MVRTHLAMQETGRDAVSIPGSGRSAGRGHGNLPQDFCLENLVARGAWWAIVRVQRAGHDSVKY